MGSADVAAETENVEATTPAAAPLDLKKRRRRAPAMSLTSLNLDGDVPPFFTFVVDAKLAACGDFDPAKINEQIKNLGRRRIGGIVSLTENCALTALSNCTMKVLHLPTEDLTPPSLDDLLKGVMFISELNKEGKAVVVHCAKGIGRTGTMLGAYFIVAEGLTALEAIQAVRDKRPGSIHKKVQEEMLYNLEFAVRGTTSKPAGFDNAA